MRLAIVGLIVGLSSLGLPSLAPAEYPERSITLIAPFPAGGAVDIVARGLAEAVKKHLPKPVVVVNRPGAAGTIGISEVVQARPDGYTLGLGAVAILTVQPQLTALPYRTPDDYIAVMKLVTLQVVLFVRSDSPWKTARELLEYARANPGKVRVGVPGIGTILHLDLEHLKLLAKVDMTVVPFEGPQQIPALLGGHVDVAMAHPAPVLPHIKAGKIRVIGVFQEARNPLFPDAPTFKELGYDVTLGVYYPLIVPKGTPRAVVQTIHDAFKKALAEPSFVELMKKGDIDIDYQGPEAITRELWVSFEQNGKLVESLGLKKK
ncbi:MAG: tripartite tricarboxylate transporter substrate binding protein [Candidatus Rokubacteria bacterium]|nr:tripartite tricarboxylate transporter substrate binding protein [Candidatus Rokubacteria bacterium]